MLELRLNMYLFIEISIIVIYKGMNLSHLNSIKILIATVIMLKLTLSAVILIAFIIIMDVVIGIESRLVGIQIVSFPYLIFIPSIGVDFLFLNVGLVILVVFDHLWRRRVVLVKGVVYLLPLFDLLLVFLQVLVNLRLIVGK